MQGHAYLMHCGGSPFISYLYMFNTCTEHDRNAPLTTCSSLVVYYSYALFIASCPNLLAVYTVAFMVIIWILSFQHVPPGGNTTFEVVFLARRIGNVENTLHIHTSAGTFKYQVS